MTNPIADRIVRVATPDVLRRRAPKDDVDLQGAIAALAEFGPCSEASQLMLCLCVLRPGLPWLRRLAAIGWSVMGAAA